MDARDLLTDFLESRHPMFDGGQMPSLVDAVLLRRAEEQVSGPATGLPVEDERGKWKRPRAAKESTVADEKRTCSREGCDRKINNANKSGICSACSSGYKPRTAGEAKTANTLARHALAAKTVGTVTAIAPPALSDERPAVWPTQGLAVPVSIEKLLRERLAEHERQAARCRAALAALEAA